MEWTPLFSAGTSVAGDLPGLRQRSVDPGNSSQPPTIIGGPDMKEFRPAKKRIAVSVGESVRILRELRELSQSQLCELTGIPQATISAIEK